MRILPRSFRHSLIAVTVLAALLATAAMTATGYQTQKRRSEADLRRLLSLAASESAARAARWLRLRRKAAEEVASDASLIAEMRQLSQLSPEDDEYFLSLYRLKQELDLNTLSRPFIDEITIHDPDTGTVLVASAGDHLNVTSSEDDNRGIVEARDGLWLSPLFPAEIPLPDERGRIDDAVPTMFIAAPIRDRNQLYGVVRLRPRVTDLGDRPMRPSLVVDEVGTGETYLVDSTGMLLSPSRFEGELRAAGRISKRTMLELKMQAPGEDVLTVGFQQSQTMRQSRTNRQPSNLSGYTGVHGRRVVGAWAPVERTNWVCIAELDCDEAYAALNRLTRTNLLLGLSIGALVVGLATWLTTRLVAPLNSLSRVATQLAGGNRSARCRMQRSDEIGVLADVMDHMADSIDENLSRLEQNAAQLATSNDQLETELTERRRAEQELRNANAYLDSVIDNIPIMLFMKDAKDLRNIRFNKAGRNLVGKSRDELIGRTDYDLYPKEQADAFSARDRAVLDGLRMVEIDEEEIHTLHGVRILHTRKIPICDEHGRPQALLGISEDITEKKQMLEALQAAKEAAESANRTKKRPAQICFPGQHEP